VPAVTPLSAGILSVGVLSAALLSAALLSAGVLSAGVLSAAEPAAAARREAPSPGAPSSGSPPSGVSSGVSSGGAPAAPEAAWIETYAAANDRWYRHQDLAWCGGAMTVALIEERHDPEEPPAHRLWLYRISRDGSRRRTLEVPMPGPGVPGRPADVRLVENVRVECAPGGGTVVALDFPEGVPWLVLLDAQGHVTGSRRAGGPEYRMKISDLVRDPAGGWVLLGWGPETALALRLGPDGRTRGEIVRDYGFQDAFVSAWARRDGALVLAADSQGDDPLASGEPVVWVSVFDDTGEVKAETRLGGRFGSVAEGPEGGVTLVYDRAAGGEQDLWAVGLDAALEPVWELPISDRGGTLASPYTVEAGPDGSLFVLGNREDHAQLTKIDPRGRRVWSLFGLSWGRSLDFRLGLDEDGGAYVLLSEFVPGDYLGFRRKIKLAKVGR
jgi:hypothetical protein